MGDPTTYNVGLDFGFLDGRINGSVDWYLRQTDDLLNNVITPMGSNFGNTVLTNIGSMENRGVEFNLNLIPVQTKDWNLTIGLNGTFQKTEFTKLNNTDDPTYSIQAGGISKGTGNLLQRPWSATRPIRSTASSRCTTRTDTRSRTPWSIATVTARSRRPTAT